MSNNSAKQTVEQLKEWFSWLGTTTKKPVLLRKDSDSPERVAYAGKRYIKR